MPVASGNYSQQGQRITVNALLRDPLSIRARFLSLAQAQFMMEDVFRRVPGTQSGVIQYEESAPMFSDEDPALVAEGAEIPVLTGSDGQIKAAFTQKFGAGIEITRETRDRNRMDVVNKRINQVRNTFVRVFETRMRQVLDAAVTANPGNVVTVGSTVDADTDPRGTIREAAQLVREAALDLGAQQEPSYLGYEPDAILMSTRTAEELIGNPGLTQIYNASPMVERSPDYTGYLERQLVGLRVVTSRFFPDNMAYVLQRKEVGGFSDERPLSVSPLREDPDREIWRCNVVRRTAIFVDQPQAISKIVWA